MALRARKLSGAFEKRAPGLWKVTSSTMVERISDYFSEYIVPWHGGHGGLVLLRLPLDRAVWV